MPRQSNGNYVAPANTAAVSGTSISSTAFNTLETDIGTEITNSVDRGGRSAMTANLPMGSNKITGMADPTVATDGATKNYVDTTTAAFFSTGDVKMTIKTTPDTGWVIMNDSTIGSATSGASNRANADTLNLFTLIFNNLGDTQSPIYTSGGGATTRAGQTNAATAWAANCRITLPRAIGRALGVSGGGTGLTTRALGDFVGEETHLLTTGEIPSHFHTATISDPGHTHPVTGGIYGGTTTAGFQGNNIAAPQNGALITLTPVVTNVRINSANGLDTTSSVGGGAAHNVMQPITFLNAMMKL